DAPDKTLALDDLDVLERDGGGHRMAGIGIAVRELDIVFAQHGDDLLGDAHRRDRQIAGGEPLRHRHEVGLEPVLLEAEPFAESAEAADDLVDDEQDAVLAADLLHAPPIALRRNDHAARALHRLADEGADVFRTHGANAVLDLLRD